MNVQRRPTRSVRVGSMEIGGCAPVSIQSMTKTDTADVEATVEQIETLRDIGCEIIRVAVPTFAHIEPFAEICKQSPLPVVADLHFNPRLALACMDAGAAKIRVNPGNMTDTEELARVARTAAEKGVAVRIGVNSGSVRGPDEEDADIVSLMVEKTLGCCELFEEHGCRNIVVSMKTSECITTIRAYREVATRCDYPLHLGVTAAGPLISATVKSAIGIGALLAEGIGDTIRVSVTGPPTEEIPIAQHILQAVGLRRFGPEIVSCPTCGRCQIDLPSLVRNVKERARDLPMNLRIAVMGCVVNGPGEARDADIGIAGGKGFGFLFRKGKKIRKVSENKIVDALIEEARKIAGGA